MGKRKKEKGRIQHTTKERVVVEKGGRHLHATKKISSSGQGKGDAIEKKEVARKAKGNSIVGVRKKGTGWQEEGERRAFHALRGVLILYGRPNLSWRGEVETGRKPTPWNEKTDRCPRI